MNAKASRRRLVPSSLTTYYLPGERVSKEVKVVLAGQCADEVFGGCVWYPLMDAETGPAVERLSPHCFDRDHAEYLASICKEMGRHYVG